MNSEREKKEREERERERLQDRKLERREPNHARRWSPIETSFCWTPLMTLMALVRPSPFAHGSKQSKQKDLMTHTPTLKSVSVP